MVIEARPRTRRRPSYEPSAAWERGIPRTAATYPPGPASERMVLSGDEVRRGIDNALRTQYRLMQDARRSFAASRAQAWRDGRAYDWPDSSLARLMRVSIREHRQAVRVLLDIRNGNYS